MANPKTAVARRNAGLDAAFDILNSGSIRGYDGTQPTDADTALGAQVLLFECALSATAFAAAAAGSKTANAISDDTSADATGTCTWGSLVTSGGVRIMDFDAGVSGSGADMIMNSVGISSGAAVSVTSLVVSQAA